MQQYRALYRENRPEVFREIVGQEHIVRILRHQIATDTVSHAYLFCGTRGTGKTTTARILAKALNCTSPEEDKPCGECDNCRAIAEGRFIDCIEIDAASNNSVDNIRELRDSVKYPPTAGRKKVYIIDEVHMLSNSAFNALLKTLEEPPDDVVFILATTNPEKLLPTVLSRCMRMDFRRVSAVELRDNMKRICSNHGVEITDDALGLLATNADGSVRDSLSLLEQCMSSGEQKITRNLALDFLGAVPSEFYLELTEKVLTHNISASFLLLDQVISEGADVQQLMKDWMAHYRSLLVTRFVRNPQDMLNMSEENIERLRTQAARVDTDEISRSIVTLARTINDARYSTQARILMEVAIVTIASGLEYGQAEARPVPVTQRRPAAGSPEAEDQMRRAPAPREHDPRPEHTAAERVSPAARKAEPAPEPDRPRPQPVGRKEYSREELDDIWRDAFEEAEHIKPSLNVMRRASLAGIGEHDYKVLSENAFADRMLSAERELINQLVEKRVGRPMGMVLKRAGDQETEKEETASVQDIARRAAELIGVDVEIK